jgi:hypothetical protein
VILPDALTANLFTLLHAAKSEYTGRRFDVKVLQWRKENER